MAGKIRIYRTVGHNPIDWWRMKAETWAILKDLPGNAVKCYLAYVARRQEGYGGTDAYDLMAATGLSEVTVRKMVKVLEYNGLLTPA